MYDAKFFAVSQWKQPSDKFNRVHLRSYYGDAEDNVRIKNWLYILATKLAILHWSHFVFVKTIPKLVVEHSVKFEI